MRNLLRDGMGQTVLPTNLTRKLTVEGVTRAYPVYRVRLDQLFLQRPERPHCHVDQPI